jgi:diguanylate cyclase (GGDEF)-like protein
MAAATPDPTLMTRLHCLLEYGRLVTADLQPDEMHDATVRAIATVTGAGSVEIHRWRKAGDDLVREGSCGPAPGDDAVRAEIPARMSGPLGHVIAGPADVVDRELLEACAGFASLVLGSYEERRAGMRQARALGRLLDISSSARETLEPEPLLNEVCSVVEKTLSFGDVEIALVTEGRLVTSGGKSRHLDALSIADALKLLDEGVPRENCLVLPGERVVLELLDRGGGLAGIMYAEPPQGSTAPRSAETLRLLRTFADQAASALDTAAQEALRNERDRAHWLASHDELTGLGNRSRATDELTAACAAAAGTRATVVAVLVDLEGFALVNDSLGLAAGDELLRAVGERLSQAVHDGETVARIGGDEFLLIAPVASEGVAAIAKRVHAALADPAEVVDMELHLAATLGIALAPGGNASANELIRRAESACARAKANGDALAISGGGNDSRRRLTLTSALRRALDRDELKLFYQPLVDVESGELAAFEALLRWFPTDGDMVSPGEFIPLAETSGLIETIGAWVIDEACRQMREWRDNGFGDVHVGVNVAPRQFRRTDVPAIVEQALREHRLEGDALTVEVTESGLQTGPSALEKELLKLVQLGCPLAIDDFGTDYSSLARLNRLPVQWLKIDRSFMRDVPDDPRAARMVSAIIGIADALGMKTVAEGVEHEAQAEFLRRAGATVMQGFLYSPPLPPERAITAVSARPSGSDAVWNRAVNGKPVPTN